MTNAKAKYAGKFSRKALPPAIQYYETQSIILKGVGPRFLKLGRLVRYSKNDLDTYLEAQTRQSTSCNLNEI